MMMMMMMRSERASIVSGVLPSWRDSLDAYYEHLANRVGTIALQQDRSSSTHTRSDTIDFAQVRWFLTDFFTIDEGVIIHLK